MAFGGGKRLAGARSPKDLYGRSADAYLVFLGELPILIDDQTIHQAWSKTLQLAHPHQLYVYDAFYLELAIRRSLPLATLDKALRTAAAFEGVPLLGL